MSVPTLTLPNGISPHFFKKGSYVLDVNFFEELRIGLATADDIRRWSKGELRSRRPSTTVP